MLKNRFQCPICLLSFGRANGRSAHIRGKHPELWSDYLALNKAGRIAPKLKLGGSDIPQQSSREVPENIKSPQEYTLYILNVGIESLERNLVEVEEDIRTLKSLEQERDEIMQQLRLLKNSRDLAEGKKAVDSCTISPAIEEEYVDISLPSLSISRGHGGGGN